MLLLYVKKYPLWTDYILHGQVLEIPTSARYLGVGISDNLNWSDDINRVTSKARSSLGFLQRNLPTRQKQLRSAAYKAVVRPQPEYAASVFDPHTVTHINQIERVQRMAARWVILALQRTSSVTAMLKCSWVEKLGTKKSQFQACAYVQTCTWPSCHPKNPACPSLQSLQKSSPFLLTNYQEHIQVLFLSPHNSPMEQTAKQCCLPSKC